MAKDALSLAWQDMKRRRFATAIKRLEAKKEIYDENFEYSEIEDVLQTVSSVSNFPDTSSSHIIAIDRESKRILFEKNGFSRHTYGINHKNPNRHYCNRKL